MFRRRRRVVGALALLAVAVLVLAGVAVGGLASWLMQGPAEDPAPVPAASGDTASPTAAPSSSPSPASSGPSAGSSEPTAEAGEEVAGTPSPTQESRESAESEKSSPAPSASPSFTPPAEPACRASSVQITAGTDKTVYDRGQRPELALKVMNLSQEPCTLNVGTSQQVFTVTTADGKKVFSTDVCQADPQDQDMVLVPHDEQTALFQWNRRNSEKDCTRRGDLVDPGSYRLTVSLGDHESSPVAFRLTDDDADQD